MENHDQHEELMRTPLIPTDQTTGSSSFLKACFNATNALLVPYALSSGGWLSLFLFLAVGGMTLYTALLLNECLNSDPSVRTYLDIAERALGTKGRTFVSIVMNSELYMVAIGLLILEGDNLHKLFPNFTIKIGTLILMEGGGMQSFVVMTGLIILPSMLLTDHLSILSYVSATGVFSCLIILFSVVCVGLVDGIGFNAEGSSIMLKADGIPTALSLYIVCFAGHPVIPSIYSSMANPRQLRKVLVIGFTVTAVVYMLMATAGYLMYGNEVESQITLNLPTKSVSGEIAIYTTLMIPVSRYALMMSPVAEGIEKRVLSEEDYYYKKKKGVRWLIRLALLMSTVIVACLFPHFESLMAIVGSIFVVLASFLLPCLFYLRMFSYFSYLDKLAIWGIIVFGLLAGVVGTYASIANLIV
ncbi:amino acid transporter AVT1I-like isoform X2 [Impatiens glandulifera]|uniref:amino acid transporter AVT1I-like isoform X2 n=1 Tax=Impatiens glandulifera TaxID=253017 RepID=UPI001FB0EBED|nr:amino acid transporter AVT1I-like isoform X2 [Impatiens glandulifera]